MPSAVVVLAPLVGHVVQTAGARFGRTAFLLASALHSTLTGPSSSTSSRHISYTEILSESREFWAFIADCLAQIKSTPKVGFRNVHLTREPLSLLVVHPVVDSLERPAFLTRIKVREICVIDLNQLPYLIQTP